MAFPTKARKKFSDYMPWAKDQGIDDLAGASPGVSVQYKRIVQAGASPFAVTFLGQGLKKMADTTYAVYVNGPSGDENGDPATYTVNGFSIVGGADTDVLRVTIVGRVDGQAA